MPDRPIDVLRAHRRPPDRRELPDEALRPMIRQVHQSNFGIQGARKVCCPFTARAIRWRGARWSD